MPEAVVQPARARRIAAVRPHRWPVLVAFAVLIPVLLCVLFAATANVLHAYQPHLYAAFDRSYLADWDLWSFVAIGFGCGALIGASVGLVAALARRRRGHLDGGMFAYSVLAGLLIGGTVVGGVLVIWAGFVGSILYG